MNYLRKHASAWCAGLAVLAVYTVSFYPPAYQNSYQASAGMTPFSGREAFESAARWAFISVQVLFAGDIASFNRAYSFYGDVAFLPLLAFLPNLFLWAGLCGLVTGFRRVAWAAGLTAVFQGLALRWNYEADLKFYVGFYLWLASMGLLTAFGLWLWWPRNPMRPCKPE